MHRRPSTRAIGAQAEAAIRASLARDGWTLLAQNWRGGGGELDVVALRDQTLQIIEVKARARADGSAVAAVSRAKQRRLTAAAEAFLAAHPALPIRSLVFSVALLEAGQLTWIEDAFDACY